MSVWHEKDKMRLRARACHVCKLCSCGTCQSRLKVHSVVSRYTTENEKSTDLGRFTVCSFKVNTKLKETGICSIFRLWSIYERREGWSRHRHHITHRNIGQRVTSAAVEQDIRILNFSGHRWASRESYQDRSKPSGIRSLSVQEKLRCIFELFVDSVCELRQYITNNLGTVSALKPSSNSRQSTFVNDPARNMSIVATVRRGGELQK